MIDDYVRSFDFVEYRPMNSNFRRDEESNFVSFGVFAKQELDCGTTVEGLTGYLSDLPRSEVIPNVNDFSDVWHKKVCKIMLGGLSLVNSSCVPNCMYAPDLRKNKMEPTVTAKNGIKIGEEITVFYGAEYFGENRADCQCPHLEFHGTQVRLYDSWTRSGCRRTIPIASNLVPGNENAPPTILNSVTSASKKVPTKRRQRKTKPAKSRASKRARSSRKRAIESSSGSDLSVSTSDGSFTEETNLEVDILPSVFGNESNEFSAAIPNQVVSVFQNDNRISTPLREDFVADFEEFIPDDVESDKGSDETSGEHSESTDGVCENSRMSTSTFSNRFLELASVFSLSERALRAILCLFNDSLPLSNNLPSFHRIKQIANENVDQLQKIEVTNGVIFKFDFRAQMVFLLEKKFDILSNASSSGNRLLKTVRIIFNTDGVSPFKSSKFEIYPIWLMIADLPSWRRVKYRNMVLAGLYGGTKKPCFDQLFSGFVEAFLQIADGFSVTVGNYEYTVSACLFLINTS